jgi:ArsR family transcriptional regulator
MALGAPYRQILIIVNIDIRRYYSAMPRPKTNLVDPDIQLLQALGHPARLAIVRELVGTDQVCACDFTTCCDVRQPTVSHHLRLLRDAGVIASERRGTSIYYRLVPAVADRLRALAGELAGAPRVIPSGSLRRATPATQPTGARPD